MRVAAGRVGAESVLGTAMEGGRRVRMEEGSFGTVWAMGVTMGKGTGVRAGLGGTEEARLSSAKRLLRESTDGDGGATRALTTLSSAFDSSTTTTSSFATPHFSIETAVAGDLRAIKPWMAGAMSVLEDAIADGPVLRWPS